MSREIKIRAWDKRNNEFHEDKYNIGEWIADCPKYIILSQFTGLKDKNGKDIYEGDIVSREQYKFTGEKYNEISVIEYREHGFWVKDESFGWEGEDLWFWEGMKIIGNIYENPELIKY